MDVSLNALLFWICATIVLHPALGWRSYQPFNLASTSYNGGDNPQQQPYQQQLLPQQQQQQQQRQNFRPGNRPIFTYTLSPLQVESLSVKHMHRLPQGKETWIPALWARYRASKKVWLDQTSTSAPEWDRSAVQPY
ncbi:uncharacterized protein LOC127858023 [Dreissena polymorpha]|uniref:Uncharacterized protein n=1 Tax=Dreissena polymorpha TaxID=45954 RepID=A0A9D3YV75_DREPO|nr:uncharacterized protein LOC127858023 [Dreissena polymorpha]KAH3706404.1 hypothetical protein DPMN_065790 [Dreissena polymorpha]